MEKEIISCKVFEYTGRAAISLKLGDRKKAKRAVGMMLMLYRLQSRAAIDRLLEALDALRSAERATKKAEEGGISFPLGRQRLKKLGEELSEARAELSEVGMNMCIVLDIWQGFGATLFDLANLCNTSYGKLVRAIGSERLNESFSGLVFVYNLDYKDPSNREWVDYDVDAPLTHAVKEYYLDLMLHTKEGREAAHSALEASFPEIMENALRLVTDADGVKHLVDKDGVEVGTLEEE